MRIAAALSSKPAVDPADHGPRFAPKIPRAAITARSNSVSKNSATKSATAIGPHRSRSSIPRFPSPRTFRPVISKFHKSSGDGLSILGGVIAAICRNTSPTFSNSFANSTYFAASFADKCEMAPAVFAASS